MDELLKEKALLLLARERELLTLRRRYTRVSAWLTVARSLSELVTPASTPQSLYTHLAGRLMKLLDLQRVAFYELTGRLTLGPLSPGTQERRLSDAVVEQLSSAGAGLCNDPLQQPALSEAFALHRFMWSVLTGLGAYPVVMVAGFERDKAGFYSPFEEADFGHFKSMAEHLTLQLRNRALIEQLESEKRRLEELNQSLEQRVAARTEEIAHANRELGRTVDVLREKERRLNADLEQARSFQQSILPVTPTSPLVALHTVYRPLEKVGGDIYDVSELRPGHFRFFLADATGHGVQASLRTIVLKSEYDRLKEAAPTPERLLRDVNRRLAGQFRTGEMLCTACCFDVVVEGGQASLRYVNAAHPALLLLDGGGLREIYLDGPFLGLSPEIELQSLERPLRPGHVLLACTDGLSDQVDERRSTFPLAETLLAAWPEVGTLEGLLTTVMDRFDIHRGAAPVGDDVTVVGVHLR